MQIFLPFGSQSVISNNFIICYGTKTPSGIGSQTINYPISFTKYYYIGTMMKTSIGHGDNAVYWGLSYVDKDLSSMTCYRDGQNGTALDFLCVGY